MARFCTQCGHETTKQQTNLFVCDQGHQNWVNAIAGATIFIIKDGKVLFGVRRSDLHDGKLNLPGGILELHESLEECAARESKEELGVDIKLVDILGTYTDDYGGRPTINVAFIAELAGGELRPADDLGGGDVVWRAMDDLPGPDETGWPWYQPAQKDLVAWWQARK